MRLTLLSLCVAGALLTGCSRQNAPQAKPATGSETKSVADAQPVAAAKPVKLADVPHLPNAVRVHEKVISGGLPEGEEAFAELERLGIKTVISVDGALPDVAMATKHSMRYVHLPHGYDGISDERAMELAKAVAELPGPIYIHCHHGKHRSPAAAAVACVGAGLIGADQSLAILELAGTSPSYRGLYDSAKATQAFDPQALKQLTAEFPAQAKLPAMAEAMVAIEHTHDHLKALEANGWRVVPTKPDLSAAHEALMLREHYTELQRTEAAHKEPADFQAMLKQSEEAAQELQTALESWRAGTDALAPPEVAASFKRITESCTACHNQYRNVPLREKGHK